MYMYMCACTTSSPASATDELRRRVCYLGDGNVDKATDGSPVAAEGSQTSIEMRDKVTHPLP